jgi:anti-sigma factor RsiW
VTCGDGATGAGTDTPGHLVAVDGAAVDKRELTHATVRALLSDYLEDALGPDQRERVARHLDGCRACRAFRHSLERTIDLARGLPEHRLPDSQKRQILDRVATAAERSGVGRG